MAATGFLFCFGCVFVSACGAPGAPRTLALSRRSPGDFTALPAPWRPRRPPGAPGDLGDLSATLATSRRPPGALPAPWRSLGDLGDLPARARRPPGRKKAPKPFDRGLSVEKLLTNLENAQQRPAPQRRPATQQRPVPRVAPAALQYAKTPLAEGFLFRHFCFQLKIN